MKNIMRDKNGRFPHFATLDLNIVKDYIKPTYEEMREAWRRTWDIASQKLQVKGWTWDIVITYSDVSLSMTEKEKKGEVDIEQKPYISEWHIHGFVYSEAGKAYYISNLIADTWIEVANNFEAWTVRKTAKNASISRRAGKGGKGCECKSCTDCGRLVYMLWQVQYEEPVYSWNGKELTNKSKDDIVKFAGGYMGKVRFKLWSKWRRHAEIWIAQISGQESFASWFTSMTSENQKRSKAEKMLSDIEKKDENIPDISIGWNNSESIKKIKSNLDNEILSFLLEDFDKVKKAQGKTSVDVLRGKSIVGLNLLAR